MIVLLKNRNKYIIAIWVFTLLLVSCSEEKPIESDITYYPTFEIMEGELYAVALGSVFNDPGVVAREGEREIPVNMFGTVDTSQKGIYELTYTATNSDGFEAAATRTVVVHDPAIVGTDISGNIQDKNNNTRKATISMVEGTTSIFYCTDFAFGGTFPMYFQMDGDVISEIDQSYIFNVTHVDLGYNSVSREFSVTVNPQGFAYTFEYE